MKKLLIIFISIFALINTGCSNKKSDKITIISTSYPGYDFARAITKNNDNIEVKMLLKPGSETHDFEPTPQDIINIKNSDLFIYVGGDSDEWIDDILKDIDTKKTKIVKLMDLVDLVYEEEVEGMESHDEEEEEEEYDEHVWTSPNNAIQILEKLKDSIIKIDSDKKELYEENTKKYIDEIKNIDEEITNIVKNAKRNEVIFGDRFPIRYFTDQYNLKYYAAFPGCSDATEASSKTISFLIDKVNTDNIPVVFKIELSSGKIAKAIADETGAKVLEYNTAHNIKQSDFESGITYVDIMKKNIEVLKEALN